MDIFILISFYNFIRMFLSRLFIYISVIFTTPEKNNEYIHIYKIIKTNKNEDNKY